MLLLIWIYLKFFDWIMSETIKDNIHRIRERIATAAEGAGKKEDDILLVAVSKLQSIEKIYQAHQSGLTVFGENKVQELVSKISISAVDLRWHLVGHLQSNKVNKVIDQVEMIESIDSIHLIEKLSAVGELRGSTSQVLLQVNTSHEPTKSGFQPAEVFSACEKIEQVPNINVFGLMTIGALTDDVAEISRNFASLRKLSEKIEGYGSDKIKMKYLSMGMTGDFEIAINEGSNLIRIGTAIFGSR
jgi:pyridoxal phosphate enzyme (YggS family)